MNSKAQIKEKLFQEMHLTMGLVEKYRELTKPIAPENAIGRVSRMDAINNKAVNGVALVNAESKL